MGIIVEDSISALETILYFHLYFALNVERRDGS